MRNDTERILSDSLPIANIALKQRQVVTFRWLAMTARSLGVKNAVKFAFSGAHCDGTGQRKQVQKSNDEGGLK
jgi:hypothetical protein